MREKGLVYSIDGFFKWITRLAVVNFLWLFFSLIGLLVAGVFPATVTVFDITRKWQMGETDISIWMTFKKQFRNNFLKANLIGWLLTVIGAILYFNFQAITRMTGDYVMFSVFAFYLLVFFYTVVIIWVFPLISHYQANIKQYFRNAFIIGIGKLHYSILIFLWLSVILYVSLEFPSALMFFTFSVGILGWSRVAIGTLVKLDDKADQTNIAS